jgi:hypothetical protein
LLCPGSSVANLKRGAGEQARLCARRRGTSSCLHCDGCRVCSSWRICICCCRPGGVHSEQRGELEARLRRIGPVVRTPADLLRVSVDVACVLRGGCEFVSAIPNLWGVRVLVLSIAQSPGHVRLRSGCERDKIITAHIASLDSIKFNFVQHIGSAWVGVAGNSALGAPGDPNPCSDKMQHSIDRISRSCDFWRRTTLLD